MGFCGGEEFGRAGAAACAGLGSGGDGALGGGCRGARLRRGEGSGLPECQDLFQASEDAREDGGDQGAQGGGQNRGVSVGGGGDGAQASELVGQGGPVCHCGDIIRNFDRWKEIFCLYTIFF